MNPTETDAIKAAKERVHNAQTELARSIEELCRAISPTTKSASHYYVRIAKRSFAPIIVDSLFDAKFVALCALFRTFTFTRCVIFCSTRKTTDWVANSLENRGHDVAKLSGDNTSEDRVAILQRFHVDVNPKKIVATAFAKENLLSRGNVFFIVYFDLPSLYMLDLPNDPKCKVISLVTANDMDALVAIATEHKIAIDELTL